MNNAGYRRFFKAKNFRNKRCSQCGGTRHYLALIEALSNIGKALTVCYCCKVLTVAGRQQHVLEEAHHNNIEEVSLANFLDPFEASSLNHLVRLLDEVDWPWKVER